MKTLQSDLKGQVDPSGERCLVCGVFKQENNFKYSGDIYDNSLVFHTSSPTVDTARHGNLRTAFQIMCFSEKYDPNACTAKNRSRTIVD